MKNGRWRKWLFEWTNEQFLDLAGRCLQQSLSNLESTFQNFDKNVLSVKMTGIILTSDPEKVKV